MPRYARLTARGAGVAALLGLAGCIGAPAGPVAYAPPPGYAQPPAPGYGQPPGYAQSPGYSQSPASGYAPGPATEVALGGKCYAGFYVCDLAQGLPVGSQCSCPGLGAPSYGVVR